MKFRIYIFIIFNFIIKKYNAIIRPENNNISSYDASIEFFNKDKIIDKLYLNLTNISKYDLLDIKFSYTGKIIYISNFTKIDILKEDNFNYKIKWIFLFDSMNELLNYTQNFFKRRNEFFSNVLIIPKKLYEKNNADFDFLSNFGIYIFCLENDLFQKLINLYDYKVTNKNIFARIISLKNKEYFLTHLYCLLYSCLILLFICVNIFRYNINLDHRNFTFFFIRIVYFLPIIKISIILLFIMKLNFLKFYTDLFNLGKSNIITFVINCSDILFKSLFVTFSILASNGIDATLNISTREDLLNFTKKFVFIYFLFTTTIINQKYKIILPKYYFYISLGTETLVLYLIYARYKKAKVKIMNELQLAILYCYEYINSIQIKMKMILWHFRIYFLYYVIFISMNIYSNIYNILVIEKEIYFQFIEVLAIFFYCLIYKPRRWPDNFDVYFNNEFHYFDNIYSYKINIDEINAEFSIDYNDKEYNIINDIDKEKVQLNASETIQLRNKKNKLNKKNFKIENSDCPILIIGPKFYFSYSKYENNIIQKKKDLFSSIINNSGIGFSST